MGYQQNYAYGPPAIPLSPSRLFACVIIHSKTAPKEYPFVTIPLSVFSILRASAPSYRLIEPKA